ncbi:MAG TPA: hypothetical protein VLI39_20860 [Sedimentisphaerales bacterium]|nr:hypothetical protein [Sedimentisphaerales bacterium]
MSRASRNYLVPNSVVVSRGCPHACDFCYKTSFFQGGGSFYTYAVDTRHMVFRHPTMSRETIESGYWRAYERFYRFRNIARGAFQKSAFPAALRHLAYTVAWKKIDPLWSLLIRLRRLACATPMLERVLLGRRQDASQSAVRDLSGVLTARDVNDM